MPHLLLLFFWFYDGLDLRAAGPPIAAAAYDEDTTVAAAAAVALFLFMAVRVRRLRGTLKSSTSVRLINFLVGLARVVWGG